MQPHANSGSIGTVETAANRINKLALPKVSGTAGHQAAMDRRLALLHKAMGNEASPHQPEPIVPRHGLRVGAAVQATSLRPALFIGTACLIAVSGVLWLLLQGTRSSPVVAPAAYAVSVPVAEVATPATSTSTQLPPARTAEDEARALVETWRLAWSRRDVNAYLGHYSADFLPADGRTQQQWAASRRTNIAGRADIQVGVRDLRIQRTDDRSMTVTFLQDYAAGSYRENAQPKTLRMRREDTGWRIVAEQTSIAQPTSAP